MFQLAEHLISKNRSEEAVDILLDIIAIDRNWQERKAQKLVTDLFKKLGSANEVTIKGRKKLSKILF
jgi:putative thioredoxin